MIRYLTLLYYIRTSISLFLFLSGFSLFLGFLLGSCSRILTSILYNTQNAEIIYICACNLKDYSYIKILNRVFIILNIYLIIFRILV
jgi:hypothetical protein